MDFQKLRNHMVNRQIAARGITQPSVLEAMRRVPRHEFVPPSAVNRAYDDCAVSIGEGQTISQPYMVALMTQCLGLKKEKRVFEVGTGSGYQTAVLAELSGDVCSVEYNKVLFERARRVLQKFNYDNIKTYLGDGTLDLPARQPEGQAGLPGDSRLFDAVMVTAASPRRPEYLFGQLAPQGRLVAPVGDRFSQTLMLYTKGNDRIAEEAVCECTFVPLLGGHGWPVN